MLNSITADSEAKVGQCYVNRSIDGFEAKKQNFAKPMLNSSIPADLEQTVVSTMLIGLYLALKQKFANTMLNSITADLGANVGQCYVNWSVDGFEIKLW